MRAKPMTMDYIEDAYEALEKSGFRYILVVAHDGEKRAWGSGSVGCEQHLDALVDAFAEVAAQLKEKCDE